MSKIISALTVSEIKVAAKRLKKSIPDKDYNSILDIASHAITGKNSFQEVLKESKKLLDKREFGEKISFGEAFEQKPTFKNGEWYFYPKSKCLIFDGEFSPYQIFLSQLSTTASLLDFILHIQRKKLPKKQLKKHPNISPTYQVDNFISLIDELCLYYFNSPSQAIFCPGGENKEINWVEAIRIKEKEEQV